MSPLLGQWATATPQRVQHCPVGSAEALTEDPLPPTPAVQGGGGNARPELGTHISAPPGARPSPWTTDYALTPLFFSLSPLQRFPSHKQLLCFSSQA